jgi:hypothetical protein
MTSDEIMDALTVDKDGTGIDINFKEKISKNGILGIIHYISSNWSPEYITKFSHNYAGILDIKDLPIYLSQKKGGVDSSWEGNKTIPTLLMMVLWDNPGEYDCELTFFPQDLAKTSFELAGFLTFLSGLVKASGSGEYYVRYENASWRHGSIGKYSGVIFSHLDIPLA